MLGAVDATRRPHKIPPKFISYLEKHRIYDLFQEIATQLIIKKPSDHTLYMKQCLRHASKCIDSPRIILLTPPNFDKYLLVEYLEKKLGIYSITFENISVNNSTVQDLANSIRNILRERYLQNEPGWIFTDFPRNQLEARALQRIGILPTHVIEIVWTVVPSDCSSTTHNTAKNHDSVRNLYGSVNKSQTCHNYISRIRGLREAYADFLITVEIAGKTFEQLGNICVTLVKKNRNNRMPCVLRIVLIGLHGSGCRSVAKYLSHTYNLINIDFHYLLEQTKQQQSSLGKTLRSIECHQIIRQPDIIIKVIENKLMNYDCIKKGWVLTGYPITVENFKLLDLLTTPPNRVICLKVNQVVCCERLFSRRFNVISESEHHSLSDDNSQMNYGLMVDTKDYRSRVEQNLQEYKENIEAILRYAGESVEMIDGMAEKRVVCERVVARIVRPMARAAIFKLSKKVGPIEFDPDDEPDPHVFDTIRSSESIFSLV